MLKSMESLELQTMRVSGMEEVLCMIEVVSVGQCMQSYYIFMFASIGVYDVFRCIGASVHQTRHKTQR
jgi:hypothetical protein